MNITNSWRGWHNILTDDFILPANGITKIDNSGTVVIRVSTISENIVFKSVMNTSVSSQIYAEIIWRKR